MAKKDEIELLPSYLICGEDHLKRDRVLSKMRIRLEKLGDLSFNSDTFDGTSSQGDEIVDACKVLPFASEKRLVIVKDAEKLSKDSQSLIADYLEDPNPSTVLMLISDKLAKNTRLYKAISKIGPNAVIDCAPVKTRDLSSLVRQIAPSHGIAMTNDAAQALVELIGEDTVHIDGELEKLALAFPDQNEITEADVRSVVARIREPKPWDFVNAFAERDVKGAIRVLAMMKSTSSHSLLRQCVARIRELICAKCLRENGSYSAVALAKELNTQDWRVKNHDRCASRFSMHELEHALESSLECEREMKSGADADAAFLEWAINVIAK